MTTVICLMFSYLYTDFLYVYFYKNILGLKYSLKIAVLGSLCMWIFGIFGKIFPQYIWGVQVTGVTSILMLGVNFVYTILCYASPVKKRILATIIYTIAQAVMDMMGLRIAGMLTENYELTMSNENFIAAATVCSCMAITLGTFLVTWFWKTIEQKQWKYEKYQWTCVILPISQYMLMQGIATRYSNEARPVPFIVMIGFVSGIITDVYMFFLFQKMNDRKQTETELERMNHQYEVEQVRYEQLKESQEEMAKMRHDFQNYVLTLKQME